MTTNGPNSSGSESERADPVGKAASIMGGEASASPPRGRAWTEEQKRAASERMKTAHAEGKAPKGRGHKKPAPVPEPITEDEERMVGFLIGTLWNLGGPLVKVAALDRDEEHTVGKAAAPVIRKYLPMLGDWALELNLLLVVAALAQAKRTEWKAAHPEESVTELDIPGLTPAPL